MEVHMSAEAVPLRDLLVSHDKAMKQVVAMDIHINHLNQQILRASLDGKHGYVHHLTLRCSVARGIRHVYQQLADKKWNLVQETVKITDSLAEDSMGDLESILMNSGRSMDMDQSAMHWSAMFSECYRDN